MMNGDVQLFETEVENGAIVGILEVCYNGTWGLVCDDDWSDTNSQVVCTYILGYYSAG